MSGIQSCSTDIIRYLESHPVQKPPQEWCHHFPLLLSDSKGFRLDRIQDADGVPVEYLCKAGGRTLALFQMLRRELPKLIQKHGKYATIYVWSGTCDITKKIGQTKMIGIRTPGTSVPEEVISTFKDICRYAFSQGCHIKFIGIPYYSVMEYNRYKGCSMPGSYEDHDREVVKQVDAINEGITLLNTQFNKNTLQFNADLLKTRGKRRNRRVSQHLTGSHGRQKIMWHLLYDGLHSGELLSQQWLRRLHLDVIDECYRDPRQLLVSVEPQDELQIS